MAQQIEVLEKHERKLKMGLPYLKERINETRRKTNTTNPDMG